MQFAHEQARRRRGGSARGGVARLTRSVGRGDRLDLSGTCARVLAPGRGAARPSFNGWASMASRPVGPRATSDTLGPIVPPAPSDASTRDPPCLARARRPRGRRATHARRDQPRGAPPQPRASCSGTPGRARVWAVLKADGYGHGAPAVARTLERAGVDGFCVALLEEGDRAARGRHPSRPSW